MPKPKKQKPYAATVVFGAKAPPADDPSDYDRFEILLKESQKFFKRVGLQKDLVTTIIKESMQSYGVG